MKLFYRYVKEEKWVFLLFVIAVICSFMPRLSYLHFIPCQNADWGNNFISNLGLSYVAGFIIYFVTVFRPNMQRGEIIIRGLTEKLRYLIDDYNSFIDDFCYGTTQKPTQEDFKNGWIEEKKTVNTGVSIKLKEKETKYCMENLCTFASKGLIYKEITALLTNEECKYGLSLENNFAVHYITYTFKEPPYYIHEDTLDKVVDSIFDYRDNLYALYDSVKKRSLPK